MSTGQITTDREFWATREQAGQALGSTLAAEARVIYRGFGLVDQTTEAFHRIDKQQGAEAAAMRARVYGLTLIKARNLAQGCFTLSVEGLAQESGALLRTLIEVLELMKYFREDPQRLDAFLDGRNLPSAGEIGKAVQGDFQDLRTYLNDHSAHFRPSVESMRHLVDWKTGAWKVRQPHGDSVLRTNLRTLFAFLVRLLFEGASCLSACGHLSESLAAQVDGWRLEGLTVFDQAPTDRLSTSAR